MTTPAQRKSHLAWLKAVTAIPTAAGREQRVIAWVEDWVERRKNLTFRTDDAGNLHITRRGRSSRKIRPLYFTAHLDHPAFVVRRVIDESTLELEFRGGVRDAYFDKAPIEVFDDHDRPHRARITALKKASPFKRVTARLTKRSDTIVPGDVGRWSFPKPLPRVKGGILWTHACDDLAAVAAALSALDVLRSRKGAEHVGVLLTRAEEVGFLGTLAVCESGSVPRNARLICLENSRSFVDSPIGGGPILRVGDKMSVFDPRLTNRIAELMMAYEKKRPSYVWQRKLMAGGSCEATCFSAWDYETTCLCLPLGNYHNMTEIDAVLAGKRPAKVGPEHIAVSDYHGLVEMMIHVALHLDRADGPAMRDRLRRFLDEVGYVLDEA